MNCSICGENLRVSGLAKEILNEFEIAKLKKIKSKKEPVCVECQTTMLFLNLT